MKEKQLIIIDCEYELKDIMYPKHYLCLWLKGRRQFWKPTQWNDKTKRPPNCKDILEYHSTEKCTRIDSMLHQKFAYCESNQGEYVRFIKFMPGGAYELEDGSKIVVTDVELTKQSQMISYCNILEFSSIFTFYVVNKI